ncbi:(R)-limonene synthase-like isoform X2 [Salvia hispanica]|uniref:(R)-limonene synthase-like isoform X2 n=1 Tax=Salvia hispanica TaxID=49212 RepID=UPI00200993B3|nr:(R)-limonene synthase-like isoform X2 [Salvia hispanica]
MSLLLIHIPLVIIPSKPAHLSYTFHAGARKPPYIGSSTRRRSAMQCIGMTTARRSANYNPSFWDFNYIQSLTNQYTEERHSMHATELIVGVKKLLHQELEANRWLELIDDLQQLCLSHHFDQEINQILNSIYYENTCNTKKRDLYSTALEFRLLREHGFQVSQDVFDCFKNENGDFISSLGNDIRGLLQLYEASFLLTQGEETLELAHKFSTKYLQRLVDDCDDDDDEDNILESVRNALDIPIHWRVQRPNSRWFIEAYGRRPESNPIVLELAKLDFNITQAMHQQELKVISRWWKETRLSEKLPFARDRIVESYLSTIDGLSQPQYAYSRITITKVCMLVTTIDDIFDVYATMEELQLFYDTIERWDLEAMEQLPNYMQICFLTLNNFINEMAYNVLIEQDILIIPQLRKSWQAAGYTPTLNEYTNNGSISSSVPVILSHTFFLITNPIEKASLYEYHELIRCSSMILRLTNDLATSPYEMERGDVSESVQCYMKESGASVEEAREYVKFMIWETWKEMNEERVRDCGFSKKFIKCAIDLGRVAHYTYQIGDGVGVQNSHIKDRISSLFFEPIV